MSQKEPIVDLHLPSMSLTPSDKYRKLSEPNPFLEVSPASIRFSNLPPALSQPTIPEENCPKSNCRTCHHEFQKRYTLLGRPIKPVVRNTRYR